MSLDLGVPVTKTRDGEDDKSSSGDSTFAPRFIYYRISLHNREGDPDVLRLSSEKDTEMMRFFNPFSVDSSLVPGGQTQRRRG